MTETVDPYLHALCSLRPRVTALRLRTLLDAAGTAAHAWEADVPLLTRAGWTNDAMSFLSARRRTWNAQAEADRLQQLGITLIPLRSPNFPALLAQLYDPPVGLYVRGTLQPDALSVAIVGSRNASPYGRTVTQTLARPLASRGLTIVSGLAYGIDAEAHRAALAVHGQTIAVLGSGADDAVLYPRAHRGLAADIVAAGGAVISEFPPGTRALPEYFPQRNRIIAGLAKAVIVVEASTESGALITARLALDANRDVFAVPGPLTSPTSAGTNRLLREGAAPALAPEDILEALAVDEALAQPARPAEPDGRSGARPAEPDGRSGVRPAEPDGRSGARAAVSATAAASTAAATSPHTPEDHVLAHLTHEPRTIDALGRATRLPTQDVSAALSILELDGRIRDVGGRHYVRI